MEISIEISPRLKNAPKAGWLKGVAEKVLNVLEVGAGTEVGLVLTGQRKIRRLNRTYRGKDKPTDVLSFGMGDSTDFILPPDGRTRLGEVIISLPQAAIQAKETRHPVEKELTTLIVHGIVHLLGYDHEKQADKRKMNAVEKRVLERLGEVTS